jgi:hypothetical protein
VLCAEAPKPKATINLKQGAASAFAALTIASNAFAPMANAADFAPPAFLSSSNVVAEKVTRQGMYQDYDVDITQQVDDARSTYKPAKETKSKKGTSIKQHNTSLLALHIMWVKDPFKWEAFVSFRFSLLTPFFIFVCISFFYKIHFSLRVTAATTL